MAGKLEGKIALVTGGGGGKGLALARVLWREGATIILTDIDEEGARSNAAGLESRADFSRLDVTNEEEWASVVAETKRKHGRIDLLINSARIHTRESDLATTSLESWRAQTAVNLDGAFLGLKHCLPSMRESGGGSVVNVVSLSAVAPFGPTPAYSASHAALLNLTQTAAVNCARARDNIRVNAVVCGMSSNSPVDAVTELAQRLIPLGRPAYAEDIAEAILWLASEDSRYSTGTWLTLDGGYMAEGYTGA